VSDVLQWFLVAAIVLVAGAYAARALMPPTWRRALAARLRDGGNDALAAKLDSGGGCDACPGNSTKPVQRR
jgi:hypothetical protein